MKQRNTYKKIVIQMGITGKIVGAFDSTMEAERETGINHSNISRSCKNKHGIITAGGYIWKYYDDLKDRVKLTCIYK